MENNKKIIFDMDGVIFDSERIVGSLWEELGREEKLCGITDVYRLCVGVKADRSREIFREKYGADFPYDEYKARLSRRYHERYDGGRLPLKPGARELLKHLHDAGWHAALASSTRLTVVEKQIEDAGLSPYFDVILGGESVLRSKPEPDIFLLACEKLGAEPELTHVIEDSPNGIRAAHAGGMIPIMVPDTIEPDEEIRKMARHVLPDLFAVDTYLFMKIGERKWSIRR